MTAARAVAMVLALAALALAALTAVPSADAAKPAKLGDRQGMQLLEDLGTVEKRANRSNTKADVVKATRAQARVFDRYAKKVRASKCQRQLKGLARFFRRGANTIVRYGVNSPQQRKLAKSGEKKFISMSGACS